MSKTRYAPLIYLILWLTEVSSNDLSLLLEDTTTTTTTTTPLQITTTASAATTTSVLPLGPTHSKNAGKENLLIENISEYAPRASLSSFVNTSLPKTALPHPLIPPPRIVPDLMPQPVPPPSVKVTTKFFNKSIPKKRKSADITSLSFDDDNTEWKCPNITGSRSLECGCDLPHTLRCSGNLHGLTVLADSLRSSPYSISLLDCSLRNVTFLSDAKIFDGISLHGLVISSGEIKRVHKSAFLGIKGPLQALGLPSNALLSVPWNSISSLTSLERLDLSNNKIKALGTSDFAGLINLVYLELSNNQISSISQRAFANLRQLEVLKLAANRLGDYPSSLKSLSQCYNLRQLDLTANNLNGPLSSVTLPGLRSLESLDLNRNLIKSIQNKALQNFSHLTSLSLRHNQIDVLQDHAFYGLGALENLDLSYNGIVAISSASLQHLTRLRTLDLTHNFLRALTSDLITPLPSLHELRLAGNDISIVAKNALDGAKELKSLLLQDNPLSCDCTMRPFAEWLQVAKIQAKDLISPTCVTPPRLEGAPLIQVPVESLNCDMDNVEKDNANIIEHLETFSRLNESLAPPHVRDLSEEIILHELHYSADYGLILTWILNLSKNDYMCDAIFVYKEENINEILIDNSPIHCESKIINGQNTVSVIVPDSSTLDIGESYRFCLVMIQEGNPKAELNIGCSNITQLQLSSPPLVATDQNQRYRHQRRPTYAESKNFERTSIPYDDHDDAPMNPFIGGIGTQTSRKYIDYNLLEQQGHKEQQQRTANVVLHSTSFDFLDSLNRSFLPGLGLGILVTSIVVLIWGAARLRQNVQQNGIDTNHNGNSCNISNSISSSNNNNNNNNGSRPSTPTATTCYAASEHITRLADSENGARYLKLQATTSL